MSFHGIFSLMLCTIALIIGLFALEGRFFWIYLLMIIVFGSTIGFLFCRKCNSNKCGHYFPRKILDMLNIKKKSAKYTRSEIIVTSISILVLIIFPQYYLIKNGLIFWFWGIGILSFFEIRIYVCSKCQNVFCPAYKKID